MATTKDIKKKWRSNKYEEGDEIVKSFTEPDLFIYRKKNIHSAMYIPKGSSIVKLFKGGSSFKKHFTNFFDVDKVTANLSKYWSGLADKLKEIKEKELEVPEDIQKQLNKMKLGITKLWGDKGFSTSSFGTAIHKYRELTDLGKPVDEAYDLALSSIKQTRRNYMANLKIGETIMQNSKSVEENYAKPTHEDIRSIMKLQDDEVKKYIDSVELEFLELYNSLGFNKYKSLPEEYVTYSKLGMGGEIDKLLIIDSEKKICRVIDYKVNEDLDVLDAKNELLNELSKYNFVNKKKVLTKKASKLNIIKIQLSYYAYCLYKAGWTVEGADVFGRNGTWEHYKIDLIPMDEMDELLRKYL